jgi:predicted DsbA family dithiol-disulfide isomerase
MSVKIIHFSSPSCSICVNQDVVLKQVQEELDIPYQNMLITTAFAEALQYGVKAAPTLVFLADDRPVRVSPGFQTKDRIKNWIAEIQG